MPRTRPRAGLAAGLALVLVLSLAACGDGRTPYLGAAGPERAELRELFAILDDGRPDPVEDFAAVRQIASILMRRGEHGILASFLTGFASGRPDDPYLAWYYFAAALAYEAGGSAPLAAAYYDRVVKTLPDLEVDGTSIHHECLHRLIDTVPSHERRIEFYKDLIARFPDEIETGRVLFLLGKEYEAVGEWDQAVETYARYLPNSGSSVPGHPDAFQYARNVVDFYNSSKDWAYESLAQLVANVKAALAAGDPYKLRRYRAKVNFFAVSWHQDETDSNSQVLFDFAEFMTGGRVMSAEGLDPSSGPRDAYLRTWGWSERISTWYLYFRKIYFPADPEIHGRWEWAGIYFGDKMR